MSILLVSVELKLEDCISCFHHLITPPGSSRVRPGPGPPLGGSCGLAKAVQKYEHSIHVKLLQNTRILWIQKHMPHSNANSLTQFRDCCLVPKKQEDTRHRPKKRAAAALAVYAVYAVYA